MNYEHLKADSKNAEDILMLKGQLGRKIEILMHDDYRKLSGSQRALFADAGTAIEEAAATAKGLKRL